MPQRCPGTCECYFTWQRGESLADVINYKGFARGKYPGLLERALMQSQCLYKRSIEEVSITGEEKAT